MLKLIISIILIAMVLVFAICGLFAFDEACNSSDNSQKRLAFTGIMIVSFVAAIACIYGIVKIADSDTTYYTITYIDYNGSIVSKDIDKYIIKDDFIKYYSDTGKCTVIKSDYIEITEYKK